MDMALQFTPPPLQPFVPRLLRESFHLPPSSSPEYYNNLPLPSPSLSPSLDPSLSPSLSPSPEPSPPSTEGSERPAPSLTPDSRKPSRHPHEVRSPPLHDLSPPWPKNDIMQLSPPGKGRDLPVGLIVALSVAGIVLAGILTLFYRRRKKRRENIGFLSWKEHFYGEPPLESPKDGPFGGPPQQLQNNHPPDDAKVVMNPITSPTALGLSQSAFTYEELVKATGNFSSANLLGEGGFGYVHKGVLPNGKMVAIKQLKAGSGQGEREFQAEVDVIGRVHHRHLVSLLGYCSSGARRMLVYEFVPNSTLEFHLHGEGRPTMNWPTRMKIAIGSAKGLAYLHEDCQPKIIHRDIKAANILLDHEFEAKVADFGLAKFSFDTDTHVSTRVMGTFGYLAPEYASSGKLTEKSDVFSFGVVLLELITGRQPIDRLHSFADDSMVEWARPLLTEALDKGDFYGLVDPKLQNDYDSDEVTRMVACAAACVRHSARLRPRMSQVLRALEGNIPLHDLNEGTKPGYSTVYSSHGSQDYNTSQYKEDVKKFRKLALESHEHGTSEYSGPSTDSGGLHPSPSTTSGSRRTTEEIEPEKIKKDTQTFTENS